MTICVGVQVHEGLVALAATDVVESGQGTRQLTIHEHDGCAFFVMTAGRKAARDEVIARMDHDLAARQRPHRRLEQLVTSLGDQLKTVRAEGGPPHDESRPRFDVQAIIGGQLRNDVKPRLFLVSPEGNWVVASETSPSFIIGRAAYGKPILDRLLVAETPLPRALALAYLAFDATRTSVPDVEFPIDVAAFSESGLRQQRFEPDDLAEVHETWHVQLRIALTELPTAWATPLWRPPADGDITAERGDW